MQQRAVRLCNFGSALLRYDYGVRLQDALLSAVKDGRCADTILLLQHHDVYTLGKRGQASDFRADMAELRAHDIDVATVPRGGQTTYHGPGQIVAYPILNLRARRLGARVYVESLEDAMVRAAGTYGVHARGRVPGRTGVWVGERKIGAVGVRITYGISCHGIALNVNTDLSRYQAIIPCGQPTKAVTSLSAEVGAPALHLPTAYTCLEDALTNSLQCHLVERVTPEELLGELGL